MFGGEEDGLFEAFVSKQAQKEMVSSVKQELSDEQRSNLHLFFSSLSNMAPRIDEKRLKKYIVLGLPLNSTLVTFAGFLRGLEMPNLDDPEIRIDVHGEGLGVRLWLGSQLFGYNSKARQVIYLPAPSPMFMLGIGGRFITFYFSLCTMLGKLGMVNMESASEVSFDGAWAGEESKTVLEEVAKLMYQGLTVDHDIKDTFEEIEEIAKLDKMMEG